MDINNAADKIKADLQNAIKTAIDAYMSEYPLDAKRFSRKSPLTAETMINLLLSMQGGSLRKELFDLNVPVTASAFVQRRKHIDPILMEDVFDRFNAASNDTKRYKGYRVLSVDGTTVNMARNPNSPCYMQDAGHPKGICQMHVNPLYDVLNKTYLHCVIQPQPKQDEVGALNYMLAWYDFPEKTLIVADRGYESFNTIANCMEKENVNFLFRVKNHGMTPIRKLPLKELDTTVSFEITTTQTNEDKAKGRVFLQTHRKEGRNYSSKTRAGRWTHPSPYAMTFRVIRLKLSSGEYETLVTDLPNSITAAEIKELYHARWGIEISFRELKLSVGLTNLHGKADSFVKQEIFASMIVANFCNRIANNVVLQRKKANVYEYQVDMKMCIFLCRKFYRTEGASGQQLMRNIAKFTEPIRPGRSDERNLVAKGWVGFVYRVAA